MIISDPTCDPDLRSWVASANTQETDFPVQNLPFGVFRDRHSECVCIGVAIGDLVLDLSGLEDNECFAGLARETTRACREETLNALMALPQARQRELRLRISSLLRSEAAQSVQEKVSRHLSQQNAVTMLMPVHVGDYTDFYASIDHAERVGRLFRPDNPLLPNYKHVPIAYHGRASSLVLSGEPVRRPSGQVLLGAVGDGGAPVFAPTRMLDYEVELGVFVGVGNALGKSIAVDEAEQHIFGCCLVNDWSARDIQSWEYQPLGPFLAKNFATSLSPWIVTLDALTPFRVPARDRDVAPPAYLHSASDQQQGAFDIQLEVHLRTAAMRARLEEPALLSQSNTRDLYWTLAQMLTHHTSNGCNLRPGDLYATGTVSGPANDARGCLLEITERGAKPVMLANGEQRSFLEDGDEVILRGYCARNGAARIGFGECRGMVKSC